MRTRIVRIGNSQGVRIPKPLLEQAGLPEDVELHAEDGRIVIAAGRQPRSGWAEAARELRARGEDGLRDASAPVRQRGVGVAVARPARVPSRGEVYLIELDPTRGVRSAKRGRA